MLTSRSWQSIIFQTKNRPAPTWKRYSPRLKIRRNLLDGERMRGKGVYFEKNKSQKKRNLFKRALPIDMEKLGSFFISGQVFIPESQLFFPYSVTREINEKKVRYKLEKIRLLTDYLEDLKSAHLSFQYSKKALQTYPLKYYLFLVNLHP